jgi:uncharacterized membrane protein YccC
MDDVTLKVDDAEWLRQICAQGISHEFSNGAQERLERFASAIEATRPDLAERDKESERDIAAEAEFLCARLRGLESELADDATAAEYYGHVVPSIARLEGLLKCAALQTNGER